EKHLARQEVIANGQAVVCEAPISPQVEWIGAGIKDLEAGQAELGLATLGAEEEVLGDVICNGRPVDRVRAEIVDAHHAIEGTDLDVLLVDLRDLDLAAL